ncbi:MAG TPA: aminotransferase class III-fold pyridoxal phosphate-dependent enzyme, partial [Naasia sp.]
LAATASGCYITTRSGRRILDATGGIGVLNHGHNHPEILKARIAFQQANRMEVHKAYHSPYLAALSANVAAVLPGDLDYSYFPNSGAEAVESSVKMAYKYHKGKRSVILHSDISFHGKLLGSGSLTGSSEVGYAFPQIPGVDSFRYGDIDSLRATVEKYTSSKACDIYAIILEPINVSSMFKCSPEFLREARRLADEHDIVLIFDEVYSGWGKTGNLFYFMRTPGVIPDILVYAKSFGGGKASISGLTARTHVFKGAYDNLQDATLQSTTYYGFGEESITAMEAVRIIVEQDFGGRSLRMEEYLLAGLERLKAKYPDQIAEIRGSGSLWGLRLNVPALGRLGEAVQQIAPASIRTDKHFIDKLVAGAIVEYVYREHDVMLFLGSNQDTLLKMSLSLIAEKQQMDELLAALDAAFAEGLNKLLARFLGKSLVGSKSKV